MKLSIVVYGYDYGRFLAQAIDSALAVDWPDKEVIVVDDCSTDDSRAVMERYADRATLVMLGRNVGQNGAAYAGYQKTSGEIVYFLDADDAVLPTMMRAVAEVWSERVSCVQWGVRYADRLLNPTDTVLPVFTEADTPERIREVFRNTGFYDCPGTSGNVWSRAFVEEIGPFPTRDKDNLHWFDDYLHLLAPFFGDVVCLTTAQSLYRVHGANDSYLPGFSSNKAAFHCLQELLRERLVNDVLMARKRFSLASKGISFENMFDHMSNRLVHKRFHPDTYPLDESKLTVFRKYVRALHRAEMSPKRKARLLAWGLATTFAPLSMARLAGDMRARRPNIWNALATS